MKETARRPGEIPCGDETLKRLCREAQEELEDARNMNPMKLGKEVDSVERKVVRLRDCLIARLRRENGSDGADRWRPVLDRVNMALSFIVAVEYPVKGIHRNHLDEAAKVLKETTRQVQ